MVFPQEIVPLRKGSKNQQLNNTMDPSKVSDIRDKFIMIMQGLRKTKPPQKLSK